MSDQTPHRSPADTTPRAGHLVADCETGSLVQTWFDAHAAELTAPLPADEHGVSEADYAVLLTYVSGEGTPDDRAALERRLAAEPALATLAESLRATWTLPLPEILEPPHDVEASLHRLYQRAAAVTPRVDETPAVSRTAAVDTAAATSVTVSDTPPVLSFPTRHRAPRISRWAALAAALLLAWLGTGVAVHRRGPAYHYRGGAAGTTVTLPDGSIATLAPGSYLGTEHGFPTRTRVVGTSFTLHFDTTATWRITVTTGAVSIATFTGLGQWRTVQTLTAGQALHVPFLFSWMAQVGHELRAAGVPPQEAVRFEELLRHAAISLGAEAAHEANLAK